jgi:hypothetical protein
MAASCTPGRASSTICSRHWRPLLLATCLWLPALLTQPLAAQSDPVEVRVTARQPGPPLWRVSKGDNSLWILPLLSTLPEDLEWDDRRLRQLLAETEEAISPPDVDISLSRLVVLNPLNLLRGYRLARRLGRNPEKASLAEALPPELYARYAAIRQRYFPRDDELEQVRPAFAASMMLKRVLDAEQLTRENRIGKQVERLLRKQRQLRRTNVTLDEQISGGWRALATRAEAWAASLPPEQELLCFERQLDMIERRLPLLQAAAEAWAGGRARELEDVLRPGDLDEPCLALLLQSSEGALMADLLQRSQQRWLEAAEAALARNRSSFSLLSLAQISGPDSLLDELERRGYQLQRPD